MRLPTSSPRPRAARWLGASPSNANLPQQRATLDGLEVCDSTWDEWVACELAEAAQRSAQVAKVAESGEGPLRRLMRQ